MPDVFAQLGVLLTVAWAAAALAVVLRVRLPSVPARAADAVFHLAAIGYCIMLATLAIMRHDSLHSHAFDLGIFDQILWNSARGHVMEASLIWDKATFLGNHISPTLLLFVPAYWLVSDPRVLLIGQAIALTSGALPIYWYARRESSNRSLALVLALSYFTYPATLYVNLFDFHEFALAVPFMSFSIYFMLTGRFLAFAVCALLLLATKEDLGVLVSMLGLRALLFHRQWLVGLPLAIGGVVWTALAISTLIPAKNPSGIYPFEALYAYLGASQLDILVNLITHPMRSLQIIFEMPKIEYVLRLLVPLGLLPLAGLTMWPLALPTLAYLLLSADPGRYSITTQYSAPLVPLFFFAAVEGCRRIIQRDFVAQRAVTLSSLGDQPHPSTARRVRLITRVDNRRTLTAGIAAIIAISALGSYVLHGPGLFAQGFDPKEFQLTDHARTGLQLMKEIPADASVIAQGDLVPQLSGRRVIYMWPWIGELSTIDYILLDQQGNKYPLDDPEENYFRSVEEMRANTDFVVEREEDGYLLLRNIQTSKPAK
ncbi:MAG: DUF2079 domain-containing protein [Chloroflexota bacterium]|nr:MAG: DUF2079 domain-containing protein [Chloroflexota bacterium]